MNKQELIVKIAETKGTSKKEAGEYVDAILDAIVEGIKADGKVNITGYFAFEKAEKPAREGVTKLGGVEKAWKTEAGYRIRAKIGKVLSDVVK